MPRSFERNHTGSTWSVLMHFCLCDSFPIGYPSTCSWLRIITEWHKHPTFAEAERCAAYRALYYMRGEP